MSHQSAGSRRQEGLAREDIQRRDALNLRREEIQGAREFAREEREASQEFASGESQKGRDFQKVLQDEGFSWRAGQSQKERDAADDRLIKQLDAAEEERDFKGRLSIAENWLQVQLEIGSQLPPDQAAIHYRKSLKTFMNMSGVDTEGVDPSIGPVSALDIAAEKIATLEDGNPQAALKRFETLRSEGTRTLEEKVLIARKLEAEYGFDFGDINLMTFFAGNPEPQMVPPRISITQPPQARSLLSPPSLL